MTFEEGDAEALPYRDGSFDVVATLVGAMFAPRQNLVAAELTRVCRPGGVIAMANWAPEMTRRTYRFDYPFTPAGVVDFFRANYGPMTRAFATLDEGGQPGCRARLWYALPKQRIPAIHGTKKSL